MKGIIFRGVMALMAFLLLLAYLFLPWVQESSGVSSNARDKLELNSGESRSWKWIPEDGNVTKLAIRLSGLKKAQGMTLTAELADPSGQVVASVSQSVSDLEDAEELVLSGNFRKGTEYTLSLSATGEGDIKVRGEETETGFYPQLVWFGAVSFQNPALLYFAAGCFLLTLVPLRDGKRRTGRRKDNGIAALLPWGTFILVAGVGSLLVFLKPPFTEGYDWQLWDEEIHWAQVQSMILAGSEGLSTVLGKISSWTPGYLPLVLGANLAGLFTSQIETLYRSGTACSVLIYALLTMMAVRHAPRYKVSFLVAAALPAHLFLASGMIYDTVVIGCILLGTALLLEMLDQEGEITGIQGMTLLSVLAVGTVAKPAYSVVLLLPLLLPAKKFSSRTRAWLFRLLTVALLAWCIVAVALPGAYDTVRSGDSRYEGTDAAAQILFLNSHPLEWVLLPLGHLRGHLDFLLMAGISHWAHLGSNPTLGYVFCILLLGAAPLAVCGETNRKAGLLKPGRRILLGITAILAECILILTQYVVSSPVGGELRGMQARYFLPVWILLALALMFPERLRKVFRKPGPWITAAVWMACFGINVWYALSWLQSTGCI